MSGWTRHIEAIVQDPLVLALTDGLAPTAGALQDNRPVLRAADGRL